MNALLVGDGTLWRHKMHGVDYMWHYVLLTFLHGINPSPLHWVGPQGEGITELAGLHLGLPPLIVGPLLEALSYT